MVGFAFVDDTDLIQMAHYPDPIFNKDSNTNFIQKQKAQKMAHMWEGLIRATGGALQTKNHSGTLLTSSTKVINGSINPHKTNAKNFT